jgi:ankyrin repeat protein
MEFKISPADAENELIEIITKDIDSGVFHINSKIEDMTFLMFAVSNNQKHLAKWLIEKGINVDAQGADYGLTALMMVVAQDNIEMVKLLLDAKANINIQSTCGARMTALTAAVVKGNIETVKLLIAYKPDLHIIDEEGNTALMVAELMHRVGIAVLLREAEEQNNIEGKNE